MKQHAVPQEIMSVEFNLFGVMNLRQFAYVAGAGGVGYLAYLIMPGILKWPLAGICVLFGLGLAFVPINDQPMDKWVTNFLLALKNPSRRVWKKTPYIPVLFQDNDEALKKEYKAKPTLIGKRTTDMRGAGVFSHEKDTTRALDKEVEEVDKELESFIKEAKVLRPGVVGKDLLVTDEFASPQEDVGGAQMYTPEKKEVVPTGKTLQLLTNNPNVINGYVFDRDHRPLPGALVAVRDVGNRPIQVLKTDLEGMFLGNIQLPDGEYTIGVEREGYMFGMNKVILSGNIVNPVEIVSV